MDILVSSRTSRMAPAKIQNVPVYFPQPRDVGMQEPNSSEEVSTNASWNRHGEKRWQRQNVAIVEGFTANGAPQIRNAARRAAV